MNKYLDVYIVSVGVLGMFFMFSLSKILISLKSRIGFPNEFPLYFV